MLFNMTGTEMHICGNCGDHNELWAGKKMEAGMTAGVLKQDPNT